MDNRRYSSELVEDNEIVDIARAGSLWNVIRAEVQSLAEKEPILTSFFHGTILNHDTLGDALSFQLASRLDSPVVSSLLIREVIEEAIALNPTSLIASKWTSRQQSVATLPAKATACHSFTTRDFMHCNPIELPIGCGTRNAVHWPGISRIR
jgi:hypothetical protein